MPSGQEIVTDTSSTLTVAGRPRVASEWVQAPQSPVSDVLRQGGYPGWLAHLLARRGVVDVESARAFLEPNLDQLHDPYLLEGMETAVARLERALEVGEKIALVGDYDVDGVSGTALLTAVFRACGLSVETILPHRAREGYGFQPVHVERARAAGCTVVVTVDCGASSVAAAQAAVTAGFDVIVTDHHLPGEEALPAEVVQINPRQDHCQYPFADLSGAGLAFKLALALARARDRGIDTAALTRVACLGTIADLVPLHGENRVIAAVGLRELATTRSLGLKALIRAAGLRPPFTAADVGYRLGPRLNAPGRLDSAEHALELLLTRDARRAESLAEQLDQWNRQRQECERKVTDEAREIFLEMAVAPPILVAWSKSWHRGVVGIAAGRLAREFHRPVLLLGEEDGLATGSGRSLPGIHLHAFFADLADELVRFGGHAQAVGMTVESQRLEGLRQRWEEAAETWRDVIAVRRLEYELELAPRQATAEFNLQLQRLEPFGQGNPAPLIRVPGPLRLARSPRIFGKGHLSAEAIGDDGGRIRLLGWGWAERSGQLQGEFEVLGRLEEDRYRGGSTLRLVDCRDVTAAGVAERESGAKGAMQEID